MYIYMCVCARREQSTTEMAKLREHLQMETRSTSGICSAPKWPREDTIG